MVKFLGRFLWLQGNKYDVNSRGRLKVSLDFWLGNWVDDGTIYLIE